MNKRKIVLLLLGIAICGANIAFAATAPKAKPFEGCNGITCAEENWCLQHDCECFPFPFPGPKCVVW